MLLPDHVPLNSHHLSYKSEYTVELHAYAHKTLSTIQRTKATPEQLTLLWNFHRAISLELERMALELDTGQDCRVVKPKTKKKKK